ncbi:Scr1 family TA system antitoxin-like transcriptional regulator [Kitasatospora sp. NPDC036755]|uniref:Scr1 family TA system antitoxin-like transcriptional regulator n=1 Tax=Kitasatospora sp. NPDC036755 TaxID=3154600 RepID=UPI0033E30D74
MTTDGPRFEVLQLWAAKKLGGVPFADGVPLLPLGAALDRIVDEVPRLGGPHLGDPSVERLAETLEVTACRLRRTEGDGPRPVLLTMLAHELHEADSVLRQGEHLAGLDRVRRVCVTIVCLEEITAHTAGPGAGQTRLRAVGHHMPPIAAPRSPAPPPAPELPWHGPVLADAVLGAHLRHLRECQGMARADVTARLPTALQDIDVEALEAGRGPTLREKASDGHLLALLRAYGAGALAADFEHCLTVNARTRPGYFMDRGPARAHRYQLLEQRASSVLLTGALLIPAALRVPAYDQAVTEKEAPRLRVADTVATRPATLVPDQGCPLCRAYRADQLHGPQAATAWLRQVGVERAANFEARLRGPGAPPTTLLLDSDLLRRPEDAPGVHADQMLHLAHLARTTALRVRVLPPAAGVALTSDTAELTLRGRTLSAVWGLFDITYQHGDDLRPHTALERALPPEESTWLLERAAAGDLPRRTRW